LGRALSHRAVIAEAKAQGLQNVLVFEDDVRFTADAIAGLQIAIAELSGRAWKLLYLGACRWDREFPPIDGLQRLAAAGPVTCTHAVAYHPVGLRRHSRSGAGWGNGYGGMAEEASRNRSILCPLP